VLGASLIDRGAIRHVLAVAIMIAMTAAIMFRVAGLDRATSVADARSSVSSASSASWCDQRKGDAPAPEHRRADCCVICLSSERGGALDQAILPNRRLSLDPGLTIAVAPTIALRNFSTFASVQSAPPPARAPPLS